MAAMAPQLQTYDNVPVSPLGFDGARGWSDVPRAPVVDWLTVLTRVARVLAPGYDAPEIPYPLAFQRTDITSDGPYGSSENFYYLGYHWIETPAWLLHFESGRHEGNEPLCLETRGLEYNVSSFLAPGSSGPARARFFVWHTDEQAEAVRAALFGAAIPTLEGAG